MIKNKKFQLYSFICSILALGLNCDQVSYEKTDTKQNLYSENITLRRNAIITIHSQGKLVVDELIKEIESEDKIELYTNNPLSSTIDKQNIEKQFKGVFSIYMIDLIISREVLKINIDDNPGFLLGFNDTNYIYWQGYLVKENSDSLDIDDMRKIKNYYEIWWNKKNKLSIETIREDWNNNDRPLIGTEYSWR